MALRLGSKDIARLSAAAKATIAEATPGRRRTKAALIGEAPSIKGGRLARRHYDGPKLIVGFDLAPQPKERARTFVDTTVLARAFAMAHGDMKRFMATVKGRPGLMNTITPENTRIFEEAASLVAARAVAEARMTPYECPLEMIVEFRFEGDIGTWPTGYTDGDLDNIEKTLKDSLNKVAYTDDRLVTMKTTIKVCSPIPGISMALRPAPPEGYPSMREVLDL